MDGLSQNEAKDFVGVDQATISRWISSGILQGVPGGGARGKRYKLQPRHLMQALAVKELRDQGASLQRIRPALAKLRERSVDDWHERWLFVDNNGDIGSYDEDRDVLMRIRDGSGYCVDVAGIRERMRELQSRLAQQETHSTDRQQKAERDTVTA